MEVDPDFGAQNSFLSRQTQQQYGSRHAVQVSSLDVPLACDEKAKRPRGDYQNSTIKSVEFGWTTRG